MKHTVETQRKKELIWPMFYYCILCMLLQLLCRFVLQSHIQSFLFSSSEPQYSQCTNPSCIQVLGLREQRREIKTQKSRSRLRNTQERTHHWPLSSPLSAEQYVGCIYLLNFCLECYTHSQYSLSESI